MVKRKGSRWLLIVIFVLLLVIISLIVISLFLPKKDKIQKFYPLIPPVPTPKPLDPFPLPEDFPDQGCNGEWFSGFPCENAFDGNWDTYTYPASGHESYLYKKFQIPIDAKNVILKIRGYGEAYPWRDCGLKIFFYNYTSGTYIMLVNDNSTNTLIHELMIPIENLNLSGENYLLNVVIKGAYYPGSCGTHIHEMEVNYS